MRTISFISANYVARARNYDGNPDWGAHDAATVQAASPAHFAAVCADVAAAGFEAIDVWMAHCHWKHHDRDDYLEQVKGICSQHDLAISSYAGGLLVDQDPDVEAPFRFAKRLGAPMVAGGLWGGDAAALAPRIDDACARLGVTYAFENHPEKSVAEILAKIDGGRHEHVGVALDTGWCGTQGLDAVEAARALRHKLFIVHLKDVREAGKHDTCALGDGIVPVEKVVRHLVETGWEGTLCVEHEPYDRDPMPEVVTSLRRLREWLS